MVSNNTKKLHLLVTQSEKALPLPQFSHCLLSFLTLVCCNLVPAGGEGPALPYLGVAASSHGLVVAAFLFLVEAAVAGQELRARRGPQNDSKLVLPPCNITEHILAQGKQKSFHKH